MLPDKSVLMGQKLVESAKIQIFKCDILSNFQTICSPLFFSQIMYEKSWIIPIKKVWPFSCSTKVRLGKKFWILQA